VSKDTWIFPAMYLGFFGNEFTRMPLLIHLDLLFSNLCALNEESD